MKSKNLKDVRKLQNEKTEDNFSRSCSLDITPEFNERKQKAIHELFLPGQLISMGKADVSIGGSVSNTGLAMKKWVEMLNY